MKGTPRKRRGPAKARASKLARLEAELERTHLLVCTVQDFWREELRLAAERAESQDVARVKTIQRLRAKLSDIAEATSRRNPGPSPAEVSRRVKEARKSGMLQKAAELQVATDLMVTDRTVRRRLREFADLVNEDMRR